MKVGALFSGGKDSVYSIYIASQWGWEITHLISLLPINQESFMFHTINIDLVPLLSQALVIPLVSKTTHGEKETELKDLEQLLSSLPIDGVISGAIASEYQRTRIEQVCDRLDIKSHTPLWHKNQELLLQDQIKAGFSIIITGVFAEGLDESWLGKTLTIERAETLFSLSEEYKINPAGEGGEFETLTLDGPIFKKHLVVDESEIKWTRDNGYYLVKKAHVES
jgi:ABC transporter with metal-binding/Fe-S-binding domain ATP-binding protein